MDPALMAQFQMGMPGMMMGAGMSGMDPNMANMMQQQYAAAGYGQVPSKRLQRNSLFKLITRSSYFDYVYWWIPLLVLFVLIKDCDW